MNRQKRVLILSTIFALGGIGTVAGQDTSKPPVGSTMVTKPFNPSELPGAGGPPVLNRAPGGLSELDLADVMTRLCELLKNQYVDAPMGQRLSDQVSNAWKAGMFSGIKDPSVIAAMVTAEIKKVVRDPHLRMNFAPNISPSEGLLPNASAEAEEVRSHKNMNNGVERIEILAGNVGYLRLSAFIAPQDSQRTLDAAMRVLENSCAIVVDLRSNRGGDPEAVNLVASYFFAQSVHLGAEVRRDLGNTKQYWTDANKSGPMANAPLVILTDAETASAGEAFAYHLQALKRATIVGQTTAGAAHPTLAKDLGHGFNVFLPVGRTVNSVTGTDWEGQGVVPDMTVAPDLSLHVAHTEALRQYIAQERNAQYRAEGTWDLQSLLAKGKPVTISRTEVALLVGRYGSKVISSDGDSLWFQPDGLPKVRLIPIEPSLFDLEGVPYLRLQVQRTTDGKVSGLKALFRQGFEERYARD